MTRTFDLSEELQKLATSLDLPDQLYEEAVARYDDVAEWLSQEGSPLRDQSPVIYPQGSFRLGTMVRPVWQGGEFDIDLVCRLSISKERTTQVEAQEERWQPAPGKRRVQKDLGRAAPLLDAQLPWGIPP